VNGFEIIREMAQTTCLLVIIGILISRANAGRP
jgi:hypothetical protein